MRSTVVPAQITTVEDKIMGNIGMSQLILLTVPIFGGSALFMLLPPFFGYSLYKIVLITVLAALCGALAIRIKGKVVLFWGIALLRYNLRPRYYVFNKNNSHLRDTAPILKEEKVTEPIKVEKARTALPQLSTADLVKVESLITNPQANLHFKTNRKGELYVHITEIQ
ncbi:MAG TPA: PrgI family protein [Candidatus Saccharimonadales bacterium]|nr:PrgI family protein [Candidatus Saccharimonadales bacterium]